MDSRKQVIEALRAEIAAAQKRMQAAEDDVTKKCHASYIKGLHVSIATVQSVSEARRNLAELVY